MPTTHRTCPSWSSRENACAGCLLPLAERRRKVATAVSTIYSARPYGADWISILNPMVSENRLGLAGCDPERPAGGQDVVKPSDPRVAVAGGQDAVKAGSVLKIFTPNYRIKSYDICMEY